MLDDRNSLLPHHLDALSQQLLRPTDHTQRLVEHLSFSPAGGQLWRRELQIHVPSVRRRPASTDSPRLPQEDLMVVSLGLFQRVRFPDFVVRSEGGARLGLLTRLQHGHCLTMCLVSPLLAGLEAELRAEVAKRSSIADHYHELLAGLMQVLTAAGPAYDRINVATRVSGHLGKLLVGLGLPEHLAALSTRRLGSHLIQLQGVTQYLCWVPAVPGQTVCLEVRYSIADAPSLGVQRRNRTWFQKWADARTRYYARTGIGPINYELRTPAHDHAGSYYLTVDPPKDTSVPWLDAGLDQPPNEIDCSKRSLHIHNGLRLERRGAAGTQPVPLASTPENAQVSTRAGDQPSVPREGVGGEGQPREGGRASPGRVGTRNITLSSSIAAEGDEKPADAVRPTPESAGAVPAGSAGEQANREATSIRQSKVHAFLQVEPIDTKKIVFGAILNIIFAYLLERNRLGNEAGGVTVTGLLLTPAALIAYIAQQERHYYSSQISWLRGIVWAYVAINVVYIVSISSDLASKDGLLDRNGFTDDLSSAVMAICSLGVAVLFALVGTGRHRVIDWLCKRTLRRTRASAGKEAIPASVSAFAAAARRYGDAVVVAIAVGVVGGSLLLLTETIQVSPAK